MKIARYTWDGADPELLASEIRELVPPLDEVTNDVAAIVRDVRERGDEAVLELTARHDATDSPPGELRVDPGEVERAAAELDDELRSALRLAARNIRLVAESELREEPETVELPQGQTVMVRDVPVRSAGIYAPG